MIRRLLAALALAAFVTLPPAQGVNAERQSTESAQLAMFHSEAASAGALSARSSRLAQH
jgi:hypothetical protein